MDYFKADGEYSKWIQRNEVPVYQTSEINSNDEKIKISIVTAVFNPPHKIFQDAINSILDQTFKNWEWCIVNGSTDIEIKKMINKISEKDQRIKVIHEKNEGISSNSNKAIKLTTGEILLLFDHDDVLSPFALDEVIKEFDKDEKTDAVYSDSDKISEDGIRFEPFFKPDWSPEMMLSVNYVAHLFAFKKLILDEVGYFRNICDGAQDWDIILRISERCRKIGHVAKILYHWRVIKGSTALSLDTKPFARNSQIFAVREHLKRNNKQSYVIHEKNNYLHCKFQNIEEPISIIIPVENKELIETNLRYIISNTNYDKYDIILVNKTNMNLKLIDKSKIKELEYDFKNTADAINFASAKSLNQNLVFLNSTSIPKNNSWLTELSYWLNMDSIGCTGSKILDKKNNISNAGIVFTKNNEYYHLFKKLENNENIWTNFGAVNWYRNFNAISYNGMLIRKSIFEENGKFSLVKNFDIELCVKLRKKQRRIMVTPFSELIDYEDNYNNDSIDKKETSNIEYSYYNKNIKLDNIAKFRH